MEIEKKKWHLKTITVLVIVRALDMTMNEINKHFNQIPDNQSLCKIQKNAPCKTAYLLRRVLSIWLENITE